MSKKSCTHRVREYDDPAAIRVATITLDKTLARQRTSIHDVRARLSGGVGIASVPTSPRKGSECST